MSNGNSFVFLWKTKYYILRLSVSLIILKRATQQFDGQILFALFWNCQQMDVILFPPQFFFFFVIAIQIFECTIPFVIINILWSWLCKWLILLFSFYFYLFTLYPSQTQYICSMNHLAVCMMEFLFELRIKIISIWMYRLIVCGSRVFFLLILAVITFHRICNACNGHPSARTVQFHIQYQLTYNQH